MENLGTITRVGKIAVHRDYFSLKQEGSFRPRVMAEGRIPISGMGAFCKARGLGALFWGIISIASFSTVPCHLLLG